MLYILGGAERSGKTLLARRAVAEKQIPYFPLDALFSGLIHGAPEYGVRPEDSRIERSNKMWPISQEILNFFTKEERDFLVEGDTILPAQVNEMITAGHKITSCFLGYTELTANEKLSFVRKYNQGEIDWTSDISNEKLLEMIDEMIEFSTYLKTECATYGLQYFDISHDFQKVSGDVFTYLFSD